MVDYPNNPPAQNTAGSGYSPNAPRNYYDDLQQAAASNGAVPSSSSGTQTALPSSSSPASAPAAASAAPAAAAPAANAAPAASFQEIAAGRVPWSGLPADVQGVLGHAYGPDAPGMYEAARTKVIAGAQPSGPRSPDAFDAGAGRGVAKLIGGVGGSDIQPVRPGEGPGAAFARGAGIGGGAAAPALPPMPEGAPVTNVAKNIGADVVPPGGPGARPAAPPAVAAAAPPPPPAAPPPPPAAPTVTMTPHGPAATAGTMANPTNVYRGAPQPAPPVAQAAAPPPPAPPVEEPLGEPGGTGVEPNTVTVKPGDTLSSIAADQLGDPRRAWQIAQANDIRHPNRIAPGMTLRLPTAAADMPSPRPRPAIPPSPGSPPVGDYFEGFLGGEPPFSGGAGAKASPGAVPSPRERPYRDPGALGADPATMDKMRQDLERLRGGSGGNVRGGAGGDRLSSPVEQGGQRSFADAVRVGLNPFSDPMAARLAQNRASGTPGRQVGGDADVAALSDNDNGPRGPSMIPGSRLPVPYDPNRMQDWLRRGTIPLPRPGNQAAIDYYGQFA